MMINPVNGVHGANVIIRLPHPTIISQTIRAIQAHDCRIAAAMMMTHRAMTVQNCSQTISLNDRNKRITTKRRHIQQYYAQSVHQVVHETKKTLKWPHQTVELAPHRAAQRPDDLQHNDNQRITSFNFHSLRQQKQ